MNFSKKTVHHEVSKDAYYILCWILYLTASFACPVYNYFKINTCILFWCVFPQVKITMYRLVVLV